MEMKQNTSQGKTTGNKVPGSPPERPFRNAKPPFRNKTGQSAKDSTSQADRVSDFDNFVAPAESYEKMRNNATRSRLDRSPPLPLGHTLDDRLPPLPPRQTQWQLSPHTRSFDDEPRSAWHDETLTPYERHTTQKSAINCLPAASEESSCVDERVVEAENLWCKAIEKVKNEQEDLPQHLVELFVHLTAPVMNEVSHGHQIITSNNTNPPQIRLV